MQTIRKFAARRSLRSFRALALVPACIALGACSSDELSLGTGDVPLQAGEPSSCGYGEDGVVADSITAGTQEEIDALAGCEEVLGYLHIIAPGTFDVRTLASLRTVRGALNIGADNGGPSSLEGLEALEEVGSLAIQNLQSADILPLSRLTWVQGAPANGPDLLGGGHIAISGSPNLVDLTGLAGLRQWSDITLYGNAALTSLNGIAITSGQLHTVSVLDSPGLRDLSALAHVLALNTLTLARTGLKNLDGLNLVYVDRLTVEDNPELVEMDALFPAQAVNSWRIARNPKLDHLPEIPGIGTIGTLQVTENEELRSIPAYGARNAPESDPDDATPEDDFRSVDISHNPKLARFRLPLALRDGLTVGIYSNANLTELDLTGLTNVNGLSIRDNPLLSSVDIEDLETVDDLAVEDNPALSVAEFAGVKTFSSTIGGNADAPAEPAAP